MSNDELTALLKKRNGKLLSQFPIRCKQKSDWECSEGHTWKASWDNVKKGSWCPTCAGQTKPTLDTLQAFAKVKKGTLISSIYVNNREKLEWECSEGHIWKASWNSIQHMSSWCPTCANLAKPSIQSLLEYAQSNQGLLLSTVYTNNRQHLLWKCFYGHEWKASSHAVVYQGHWCHVCASTKSERESIDFTEKFFGKPFPKFRFNHNKTKLEFDGYSEELKIAIEYQGYQHYIFPNVFHRDKTDFLKQQYRDSLKREYCKQNNIVLVEIPYNCGNIVTFLSDVYEQYR